MLLLLIGCAQMQAQREGEAARAELNSCNAAVSNSPEAAALRSRSSRPTLEQMEDSSYVSEPEKSAILALEPRYQACRATFLGAVARLTPSAVPILTAMDTARADNVLALIERKVTWGDYAKQRRDIAAAGDTALYAEIDRLKQADLAQRQANAAAAALILQRQREDQMRLFEAQMQNIRANQAQMNRSVNCNSTPIGSSWQTNCN
jgi:hypothetical protein